QGGIQRMKREKKGRIIYSPSDLVTFLGSPYASWMDRLHLERPGKIRPDEDDETGAMLKRRGDEHEASVLARLGAGRRVVKIDREGDPIAATMAAIAGTAELVYQGALSDGTFAGYADFLVRCPGGWEVWDAKLSRTGKAKHLLQLCCYADLLEKMTGSRAETIVLALGSGEDLRLRCADFRWYQRAVCQTFL